LFVQSGVQTFKSVEQSDVIMVIGANPTVNHPVAATWMKNAAKAGVKLIVADPRKGELARHACAAIRRGIGELAQGVGGAVRRLEEHHRLGGVAHAHQRLTPRRSIARQKAQEAKRARVFSELLPRLQSLARLAAGRGVGFTIDAEESERLELTLDLHAALAEEFSPGLAVQAYQKRALPVCEWLVSLGRKTRRRLPIRLVKGAYWDSEVKRAQQLGMPDYPVFTRKAVTDLSYVACATTLLAAPEAIYPAFATHNCRTVATLLELAQGREFEFQKLVGMGDALYEALLAERKATVRMYAPVGSFTDLLPYLVRRMLENGANTSFVHQIADPDVPLEALVADPLSELPEPYVPDPRIPLPRHLYPDRLNSLGLDLSRRDVLDSLHRRITADGALAPAPGTSTSELQAAIARAAREFEAWSQVPAVKRAEMLESAAELLEGRIAELISLIVREGGRTYADAVAEVREAADFCRYYALQARQHFAESL